MVIITTRGIRARSLRMPIPHTLAWSVHYRENRSESDFGLHEATDSHYAPSPESKVRHLVVRADLPMLPPSPIMPRSDSSQDVEGRSRRLEASSLQNTRYSDTADVVHLKIRARGVPKPNSSGVLDEGTEAKFIKEHNVLVTTEGNFQHYRFCHHNSARLPDAMLF